MNLCLIPVLPAVTAGGLAQNTLRKYPVSETAAQKLVTQALKKAPVIKTVSIK